MFLMRQCRKIFPFLLMSVVFASFSGADTGLADNGSAGSALTGGVAAAEIAAKERPEIALVLSGGGACGMAHIGALKVIEQYAIPVDYITGTSMGAIIGALYSCGYSAQMIEEIISGINWDKLLTDRVDRKYTGYNDRGIYEKSVIQLEFSEGTLKLPEGLSYGQNIYNLLSKLTWEHRNIRDFSQLPIPFKCAATDIQTGEAVILEKGNLVDAVRASMAIPSIFSAIEIDGRLLVDGGFTKNLPVAEARGMGADIVIAVDAGTPLYEKDELDNFTKVIDQVTRLVVAATAEEEKNLADLVITPDLKNFNVYNFSESREIIKSGENAAAKASEFLGSLSGADKGWAKKGGFAAVIDDDTDNSIIIDLIYINGNKRISREKILNTMNLAEGSSIDSEIIFESIEKLYGTRDFDIIRYSYDYIDEKNILYIEVTESAEQKIYLAMNYNSNENAALLLSTAYKNLLINDSRFEFKSRLGENFLFNLRYYLKLSFFGNINTGIGSSYSRKSFFLYDENRNKESRLYADFFDVSFFAEKAFTNAVYAGAAAEKNYVTYRDDISVYDIEDTLDYYKARLYLVLDTLDYPVYPDKGVFAWISGERIFLSGSFSSGLITEPAEAESYNQVKAWLGFHLPFASFLTFSPSFFYCGTDNSNYEKGIGFFIGGQNTGVEKDFIGFKGLLPGDIIADNMAATEISFNLRFLGHFVFTPYYARLYYNFDDTGSGGGTVNSIGASLAYVSTLLGPVELSITRSDFRDYPVFFFNFGFNL